MSTPYRMLVSHSTRDTKVRALWCFIDELQTALDAAKVPILLVNVVSECGGMIVEDLPAELRNATSRTDLTMMVLTRGYVDSNWCDDEMHARARSACTECPSAAPSLSRSGGGIIHGLNFGRARSEAGVWTCRRS